jgi:hypothetical protein
MIGEHLNQQIERSMVDPNMNMQDLRDAQQRWLDDGGEIIIQEMNEAQGNWRPMRMDYINTNEDYR